MATLILDLVIKLNRANYLFIIINRVCALSMTMMAYYAYVYSQLANGFAETRSKSNRFL